MQHKNTKSISLDNFLLLESFLERIRMTNEAKYRKNFSLKISFYKRNGESSGLTKVQNEIPNEIDLKAMISDIRVFSLQRESVYYLKIIEILKSLTDEEKHQKLLKDIQIHIEQALTSKSLHIDGDNLSIWDLFIYGKYQKHDLEKAQFIKQLDEFETAITNFGFMVTLERYFRGLLALANLYLHLKEKSYFDIPEAENKKKSYTFKFSI